MVMKSLRDGAKGGITKFILFGFMVLATGGLVLMDVGGVFRGGITSTDVARAGEETITIQSFDRSVRRTLSQLGLSPQEAFQAGYINQILAGEIRSRILNQAAHEQGIRISNEKVAEQISTIIAPYVAQGQDPKSVLQQLLLNQGMSQAAFIASIRRDLSNSLLSDALEKNLGHTNDAIAADLYRHQYETRDVEYLAFMNKDLKDIPAPTEDQLLGLYNATKESFAIPERRRVKIVSIKTDALKKTIDISEEEAQQTYENNIELYTAKAYHTLEQALLSTEDQATAVIKAMNAGGGLEAAVTKVTGNSAAYLGEQDVVEDNIIEDVKDEVLAAEKSGAVLGPIQSPLGWYVVKIKKISPENVKSFAEVKSEIIDELKENRLIDEQYEMANMVDDMLASGMALDQVAEEVDIEIQTLAPINQYGQNESGENILKPYGQSSGTILQSAFELFEGEASPVFENEDGKFMTVYVDSIIEKSYQSFDDAKAALEKRWMNDQRRVGTRILAKEFLTDISANNTGLDEVAKAHSKTLYRKKALTRTDDPDGALNLRSVANIFEAPLNEVVMIDIDDGVALLRVTGFDWPEDAAEKSVELKSMLTDKARTEGLMIYLNAKRDEYGAQVNQRLLQQVYGPESAAY